MCSVKEDDKTLSAIMHRVIVFYKGGISLEAARTIPLPLLFEAEFQAGQIAEENRRAMNKK